MIVKQYDLGQYYNELKLYIGGRYWQTKMTLPCLLAKLKNLLYFKLFVNVLK